jgi:hypothetical protein
MKTVERVSQPAIALNNPSTGDTGKRVEVYCEDLLSSKFKAKNL